MRESLDAAKSLGSPSVAFQFLNSIQTRDSPKPLHLATTKFPLLQAIHC